MLLGAAYMPYSCVVALSLELSSDTLELAIQLPAVVQGVCSPFLHPFPLRAGSFRLTQGFRGCVERLLAPSSVGPVLAALV